MVVTFVYCTLCNSDFCIEIDYFKLTVCSVDLKCIVEFINSRYALTVYFCYAFAYTYIHFICY
ncbi:hypothetical protein C1X30_29855 [Pseudomonas sp. FW305-BF6]|nr:hypothetical protein C1X30_29855 [Pseudomonas sp. FW305-BF6]